MPIKSLYPDLPELPEINFHYLLLRRPDQAKWPDFHVHIDAKTGKTRTFRDFVERVEWAATALGAPIEKGGLGLSAENGDMIGIMSENCMVSESRSFPPSISLSQPTLLRTISLSHMRAGTSQLLLHPSRLIRSLSS